LMGGIDFKDLFLSLNGQSFPTLAAAKAAAAPTIAYGQFLNTVVNFLIIASVIFLVVRAMSHLQKPAPVTAPTTKERPFCLSTIPLLATRCAHCTSDLNMTRLQTA